MLVLNSLQTPIFKHIAIDVIYTIRIFVDFFTSIGLGATNEENHIKKKYVKKYLLHKMLSEHENIKNMERMIDVKKIACFTLDLLRFKNNTMQLLNTPIGTLIKRITINGIFYFRKTTSS